MSWDSIIKEEMAKPYFAKIDQFLKHDAKNYIIYPPKEDIFNAFKLTSPDTLKAVIISQDPYHGGQAHGLAFSVKPGIAIPPSLRNIFKELKNNLSLEPPGHGCLTQWASNGVLLLNSILTVRGGFPGSHKDIGWQTFTDNIISHINLLDKHIVYMLWGSFAKSKQKLITNPKHLVLTANHPSPLSANQGGFFGCDHFNKANQFLAANGISEINWKID